MVWNAFIVRGNIGYLVNAQAAHAIFVFCSEILPIIGIVSFNLYRMENTILFSIFALYSITVLDALQEYTDCFIIDNAEEAVVFELVAVISVCVSVMSAAECGFQVITGNTDN